MFPRVSCIFLRVNSSGVQSFRSLCEQSCQAVSVRTKVRTLFNPTSVRPGVRCPTGEARITPGFKLPAKFVIHTVGPVYRDGLHGEPEKLAICYRNALSLAVDNGCKSIAFPCISTGVYGYPKEEAAQIAVREAKAFLTDRPEIEIVFCCFAKPNGASVDFQVYEKLLTRNAEMP